MKTIYRLLALPLASLGLLLACGDGTAPNARITVAGFVKDRVGEPISGAAVLVIGKSPVTSGSDGSFSIPGVVAPYDIALILRSQNTGVVYKGLTRSDPTLLYLQPAGAERTATISGTMPPASGQVTFAMFVSGRYVIGYGFADATTGQYAITVRWYSATNTHSGQLHVLRFTTGSTGLPASYEGYASKPLTISVGADLSGNDFVASELTDPPEQTISGTVTVPAGYTLTSRTLYLFFGSVPAVATDSGTLPSAFTYAVPAVPGMTFGVSANAEDDLSSGWSRFFKVGISANSGDVSVPLESASRLELPVNGATAVDVTTPFHWGPGGGTGVYEFVAGPQNASDPTFVVFTMGTDGKIPDLAMQGMGLPPSANYRWWVYKVFPVASVNDAAGDGFHQQIDLEAGDIGVTLSEGFGFTTRAAAGMALRASAAGQRTATAAQRFHMHGLTLQPRAIPMDAP
jgi:hypothetical protein